MNENKNKGLMPKYYIQKIVGFSQDECFFGESKMQPKLSPTRKDAEFFVLSLDDKVKDKIHLEACRKAVLIYAQEINNHLPVLSKDLIHKYS